MLSILYWFMLLLGALTASLAVFKNKNWFWVSGLFIYILSFLGSFSIGGYTLSITFVLWALATGYSLKVIKKPYQIVIAVFIGIVLWIAMVTTLDDAWWYLPFRIFL